MTTGGCAPCFHRRGRAWQHVVRAAILHRRSAISGVFFSSVVVVVVCVSVYVCVLCLCVCIVRENEGEKVCVCGVCVCVYYLSRDKRPPNLTHIDSQCGWGRAGTECARNRSRLGPGIKSSKRPEGAPDPPRGVGLEGRARVLETGGFCAFLPRFPRLRARSVPIKDASNHFWVLRAGLRSTFGT
jgi:hypothetical protein